MSLELNTECTEVLISFANEHSSGNWTLNNLPLHKSLKKKQVEPSWIVAVAIPLKEFRVLRMSFHQKEPLLLEIGRLPLEK